MMTSTSGNQGEELTKGMVSIVEYMLKMRDREALIEKVVDRTVEMARRFGGKNITDFLATYLNQMQQRDIQDLKQISSFKRVVEPEQACNLGGVRKGASLPNTCFTDNSTYANDLDREEREESVCVGSICRIRPEVQPTFES